MDFVLNLVDKLSAPAKAGAAGLSQVSKESKVLTAALAAVDKQLVKANALGNVAQHGKLIQQQTALKGALDELKPSLDAQPAGLNKLESALTELVDPAALAAVAIAAVGAAAVGLGVIFLEGASKSLEANESLEKMTAQLTALGSTSGTTGPKLIAQFDALSERLPQTRDQLAELSKPLLALGLSGDKLNTALTAQASALAIGGDRAGGTFETLQKKILSAAESGQALKIPAKGLGSLAEMGINVNDVAAKMGISATALGVKLKAGLDPKTALQFGDALNEALIQKGKPALDQAGNSLDTIKAKGVEAFTKLFEDTDKADQGRAKFSAGLKGLSGLLDQNTTSGKALHEAITGIYDKFFTLASEALPYVELGFLTVENAGLKVYIAAKPLIAQLGTMGDKLGKTGDAGKLASVGVGALVFQLQVGLTVAAATVAQINALIDVYNALTTAADGSGKAVGSALGGGKTATGLGNATQGLLSAVTGGLVSAPPTGIEGHASGGKVVGITGGLANVSKLPANASGGLVTAAPGEGLASVGTGERILPANASQGGGSHSTVVHATVHIHKEAGDKDEDITEEQLSIVLERVALKQGLGSAA